MTPLAQLRFGLLIPPWVTLVVLCYVLLYSGYVLSLRDMF